jgi:hypothetical protein
MVKGLPRFEEYSQVCSDCLAGKEHMDSIPRTSNWRTSRRLELIHFDICGLITPASNGNKRYLLTFIDDFSRKTWVYFLLYKSSALDHFKRFRSVIEKEIREVVHA